MEANDQRGYARTQLDALDRAAGRSIFADCHPLTSLAIDWPERLDSRRNADKSRCEMTVRDADMRLDTNVPYAVCLLHFSHLVGLYSNLLLNIQVGVLRPTDINRTRQILWRSWANARRENPDNHAPAVDLTQRFV